MYRKTTPTCLCSLISCVRLSENSIDREGVECVIQALQNNTMVKSIWYVTKRDMQFSHYLLIYFLPRGLLMYLKLMVLLCCDKDILILTETKLLVFCAFDGMLM